MKRTLTFSKEQIEAGHAKEKEEGDAPRSREAGENAGGHGEWHQRAAAGLPDQGGRMIVESKTRTEHGIEVVLDCTDELNFKYDRATMIVKPSLAKENP